MKLRTLTLYVAIPVLLLSAWNNAAFAVEQETPTAASRAAADQEGNKQENTKSNYKKELSDPEFWFFVVGCGVISILVKIVDYFSMRANRIEDKQGWGKFFSEWPLWVGWFSSAAIVGFLAHLVGLFQASAVTAVTIGLGWPTVFEQLKQKYGYRTEKGKIDKNQTNEAPSLPAVAANVTKEVPIKAEEEVAKQIKDENKKSTTTPGH